MGKTVVFAVAGSGKTTRIVEELGANRRCLVFTYTEENARTLRRKIALRYGGISPTKVVMTYFTFLHTFCFRPIMGFKMRNRGLGFSDLPHRDRFKQTDDRYYLDSSGRLYHSRLAKLLIERNLVGDVIERIDQFFDYISVDEVQDFAGNDFNFLLKLAGAEADMLLVGDFRQHTYDTSRDRSVNRSLHDDFKAYAKRFEGVGINVDTTSLSLSRRCSPAVCAFISERLGVPIGTTSDRQASVIEVTSQHEADTLWRRQDVVKLFYQEHALYGCLSQNWGASKGEDHHDEVCVVLNSNTLKLHRCGKLATLPPATRNKLYVALSRSRGNVYLAPHVYLDRYKST
jgi:hypothetical protein